MSSDRSYVYLVEPSRDPALMAWQAALAGREKNRANVVLIGSAQVEGYPVTDFALTPAQELARALRAKFPTSGLDIYGGRGRLGVPSQGLSPAIPTPLTFSGGSFDPPAYHATPALHMGASHTSWLSDVAGDNVTFTLEPNETSFDLVHVATPAGHATGGYYQIRDDAPISFSTYAATPTLRVLHVEVANFIDDDVITEPLGDYMFADAASAMLVGALIEVGCSGSGNLIVSEFITYASDTNAGIMVHGVGHSAYNCDEFASNPTTPGGWRYAIANLNPQVIVLQVGINDAVANSAGAFGDNLSDLISTIRAASGPIPTVPILLAAPYDVEYAISLVDPWGDYVAEMRTIAFLDPLIAFVNEGDRMPPTNTFGTFGLYHTDNVHGNADGKAYSLQAQLLAEALSFG